ncbi:MAG: DNA mismatch repair endonuclease MutL [Armatimonadetes bacterium]|nr:DNA mismatch repair endonuclease MutL [Armatimonadota bacterium]
MSEAGPRIAVLDPVVANQIAAGEVVERPASIVKELVENSLDAGASRIEVTVNEGGKRLVRVRDDGHGMGPEDAILCLQRHATSKIRTSEDLHQIQSLGFRGEALPSIASVARLRLLTRPVGAVSGVEVIVEGGVVTEFNTIGCPVGTDIEVTDLFFNVPARLKFLKTSATEMEHIMGHLTAFALLHHDVSFRLLHQDRQVFSAPASGTSIGAAATVLGGDLAREMVPLAVDAGTLRIGGHVGKPAIARSTRSHQYFFVNGRPVRNRTLTHALYEGYHTLLMTGRHPVAVVAIEVEPSAVDVNVHPAKSEVRFTREWEVHNLLRRAVREALEQAQLLTSDEHLSRQEGSASLASSISEPASDGIQGQLFSETAPEPVEGEHRLPARLRPLGQIANSYIVCDSDEGMLVIDQHALHERVLYEQFAAADAERGAARQLLAVPLPLRLSPREAQAASSNLGAMAALGFDLEPFGGDTFLVRAVPAILAHRDHERVLRDVIDDLVATAGTRSFAHHRDYVLRTMACKAAIKAGDALAAEEIDELLRLMRECRVPFHCNHGRPTMFTIPRDALDRRFGRT